MSSRTDAKGGRMRTLGVAAALAVAVAGVLAVSGCGSRSDAPAGVDPSERVTITVSAASTLKGAFEEIARAYMDSTGESVDLNFGASGELQRQIEAGAPVDVFASASHVQVDALIEGGIVSSEATAALADNELVVAVPRGSVAKIGGAADLQRFSRIAIGNPKTAPVGMFAREWLERAGVWGGLQNALVYAENAGQAYQFVANGEVDAGLLFASDAMREGDVTVAYKVPEQEVGSMMLVIAPIADGPYLSQAERFIEFALSSEGQSILAAHGFRTPESE